MQDVPNLHQTAAICILFILLCPAIVVLRIYARKIKSTPLGADDYASIICVAFIWAICSDRLYNVYAGYAGKSMNEFTPAQRVDFLKRLFAGKITTDFAIAAVKIPVLLLYIRIFIFRKFRIVSYAVMVLVFLWLCGSVLTHVLARYPTSAFWTGGRARINYGAQLVFFHAMGLALDVLILCLPLPVIKDLQMSKQRKFALVGVIWLGMFCCVAASIRLYYAVEQLRYGFILALSPKLFIRITTNLSTWSIIEPSCSLIAACLPTLMPLFKSGWAPDTLVRSVRSLVNRSVVSLKSLVKSPRDSSSDPGPTPMAQENDPWHSMQSMASSAVVTNARTDSMGLHRTKDVETEDGIIVSTTFERHVTDSHV